MSPPDPLPATDEVPFDWRSLRRGAALPLATLRADLLACPECDLLHAVPPPQDPADVETRLARGGRHLRCRRCGAALGLGRHGTFEVPAALAVAALVALVTAHLNPVLTIDLQGQQRSATLWEAAWNLWDEQAWPVAVLVLFTTLLNPLFETLAMCWLLLPLRRGRLAPGFEWILRGLLAVRPWVMVEVFMLGTLVAFVKLSSLASVLPGAGLWAFAATMLLMTAMAWAFDVDHVWASTARARRLARRQAGAAATSPATSARIE